jgi:citrate lyase subunit beta/citryl-CoA lyase
MIPQAIRTMLFVPGDRPDRIAKALSSGADCIAVDLEDAVAHSHQVQARQGAVEGISAAKPAGSLIAVRVNSQASGQLDNDLEALLPVWPVLDFVVLPMVSDAKTVSDMVERLAEADDLAKCVGSGPRLIPLIETAQGVLAAQEIAAAHPRVYTLVFGPADLSRHLGVTPTPEGTELLQARSTIVLAAAAAGLVAPIDGPWLNIQDDAGLQRSAAHARSLGFSGKLVVHPRQLDLVRQAFTPTSDELLWASEVDGAFAEAERLGVASIMLSDGTFVDYAVALRARALLARRPFS